MNDHSLRYRKGERTFTQNKPGILTWQWIPEDVELCGEKGAGDVDIIHGIRFDKSW